MPTLGASDLRPWWHAALYMSLIVSTSLLGACSGGDKIVGADGTPSTSTNTVLSSGDSVYLAGYVSAAASTAMQQMRSIRTILATGFGSSRPPCTPFAVIGGADANGNGIPDDQTTQYTAASCSFLNNGVNTNVVGSIRVQDLGTLIGYRITYTDYTITGVRNDSTTRAITTGTFEYRYASTTSGTTVDNTVLRLEVRTGQGTISLTRTAALTGTLTPTTGAFSATTFPGATMTLTGTLSVAFALTGNAVIAGQPTNPIFNIAVNTATNLTSPVSCSAAPPFTAGALTGDVSGTWRGALRVGFSQCGSGTSDNPGTKR